MKPRNVYTYHTGLPGSNMEHATKLLLLWRRNWEKAGFTPIVLNENHARQHELYAFAERRFQELPTINKSPYEIACWMRWLAMVVAGGGIMTDADVMIYGDVKQFKPVPTKITSLQTHIPCCVIGTRSAYNEVVKQMIDYKVTEKDIEESTGQPHVSDMYMFYRGGINYHSMDIVKSHGDEGWEKAPLVHFSNASLSGNREPRHTLIPKLRAF
jgi:hypothetical protein